MKIVDNESFGMIFKPNNAAKSLGPSDLLTRSFSLFQRQWSSDKPSLSIQSRHPESKRKRAILKRSFDFDRSFKLDFLIHKSHLICIYVHHGLHLALPFIPSTAEEKSDNSLQSVLSLVAEICALI